jgi:hypothetical protein
LLDVDGESSTPDDPNIVCEQFYVISRDDKHDQHFVHHVQTFISHYLQSINYSVTTLHEFCQSQYKSRNCVGNIAESFQDLGYSKLVRNFFESSHGNGSQDAAGGLLKNQADMVVVRGKAEIRCARDLYNFAEAKL